MRKIFIVIKLVSIMLTVLFVHAISTQATPIIYTINTDNNHLVQVDLLGNITDVGALGFNVRTNIAAPNVDPVFRGTIDLAILDGKLYGLHSVRGAFVKLHEINLSDGSAVGSAKTVSLGGDPILHAEGLATLGGIGGTLKIAYSPDGGFLSTVLADLSTGGIISNVDSSGSFDFDGMGSNEDGMKMYGLDVVPDSGPPTHTDFIDHEDVAAIIKTLSSPDAGNPNDLIRIGDYLLAIDHTKGVLHKFGLFDSSLDGSVSTNGGTYVGLASLNPVPEPTTVALLGVGLVGLAGAELRRRRKKKTVDKS